MWEERKLAAAQTTIRGMLMTARSRAVQASGLESGLYFYVDQAGTQYIVPIEQDAEHSGDVAWENVFEVTDGRIYTLPTPLRVVPRYLVEEDGPDVEIFSDEELANDDVFNPPHEGNHAQRHRNFFTMVFSGDGQLLVRRDVLIQDRDEDENNEGDITGWPVGYDYDDDEPTVDKYYAQDDTEAEICPEDRGAVCLNDEGAPKRIPHLIAEEGESEIALNFPSVDGLLVYDDSLFKSLGDVTQKREYLLEAAQPFYVNRYTGAIIRGPIGENVAP
jgi:hypothetical protein